MLDINCGFLNGQGTNDKKGSKGKITEVKQFEIFGKNIPYISAQAFRKWLRDQVSFNTNQQNYIERLNVKLLKKEVGLISGVSKLSGNPVKYYEDEIFGYSQPLQSIPEYNESRFEIVSTNRHTVFNTTSILPIPNTDARIYSIDGFVHLDIDTPLPYSNEFMSGYFQVITSLDLNRIGKYANLSDQIELDPIIAEPYFKSGLILENSCDEGLSYELKDRKNRIIEVVNLYFNSLLSIYPDVKLSQFATDITPKVFLCALLTSASHIFNDVIEGDMDGEPHIKIDHLEQIIEKRGHQLISDIIIGYRSGTFSEKYEKELMQLDGRKFKHKDGEVQIKVCRPGEVKKLLLSKLEEVVN